MIRQNVLSAAAAAVLLFCGSASDANAFGLFAKLHGGCGSSCCDVGCCDVDPCCEPTCCEPEPSCCEPEPVCCEPVSCCEPTCCEPVSCCDPCAKKRPLRDFFARLMAKHKKSCCCEVSCCEPSCCEPSCCEPAGCCN